MESILLKKSDKPVTSSVVKSKEIIKPKDVATESQYKPPVFSKTDEFPISYEKGVIHCNFEFACIISILSQKSTGNVCFPLILSDSLARTTTWIVKCQHPLYLNSVNLLLLKDPNGFM